MSIMFTTGNSWKTWAALNVWDWNRGFDGAKDHKFIQIHLLVILLANLEKWNISNKHLEFLLFCRLKTDVCSKKRDQRTAWLAIHRFFIFFGNTNSGGGKKIESIGDSWLGFCSLLCWLRNLTWDNSLFRFGFACKTHLVDFQCVGNSWEQQIGPEKGVTEWPKRLMLEVKMDQIWDLHLQYSVTLQEGIGICSR